MHLYVNYNILLEFRIGSIRILLELRNDQTKIVID